MIHILLIAWRVWSWKVLAILGLSIVLGTLVAIASSEGFRVFLFLGR